MLTAIGFIEPLVYRPLDKNDLETFLLRRYYHLISSTGSLRIVKTSAELILRHPFPKAKSAEQNMILCFPNGFLSLGQIEQIQFFLYSHSQFNPFPTYQVQCNQFPIMSSWEAMKTLPTPYMDAFLRTSACGIPKFEDRVWEMLGYLLSPDRNGKCFLSYKEFRTQEKASWED